MAITLQSESSQKSGSVPFYVRNSFHQCQCQKAIISHLTASGHMDAVDQPWPSGWSSQCKPVEQLDPVLTLQLHMSKVFHAYAQHTLLSCLLLLPCLQTRTLHSGPDYMVACTTKGAFVPACIPVSFAELLFRGSPIPQDWTIWQLKRYPASSYLSESLTLISNWEDDVTRSDSVFKSCISPNRRPN